MIKVVKRDSNKTASDVMVELPMVRLEAGWGCDSMWMAETPVTVGQWNEVMGDDRAGSSKHPITRVNVEDAEKFCARLSEKMGMDFRLPTEFEWLRAVGMEPSFEKLEEFAVFEVNEEAEVRTKRPNEFGLYDMRGLVWEWMLGLDRWIVRGGAWFRDQFYARAVSRNLAPPADRYGLTGFRVCCSDLEEGRK